MAFTYALLMDFLPRFIIAGVITYFFVSKFGKLAILSYERPKFILERPGPYSRLGALGRKISLAIARRRYRKDGMKTVAVTTLGNGLHQSGTLYVTLLPQRKGNSQRFDFLKDLQMILLGVDIWLLLSIVLSPVSTIYYILPEISSTHGTLLYTLLAAALFIALTGTVVSRVRVDAKILAVLLILASAATIAMYYMPSMAWLDRYTSFFQLVLIYSTVLVVCIAVYAMAMLVRRKTAFYLSAYSSIAVYMTSAVILSLNLFTTLIE